MRQGRTKRYAVYRGPDGHVCESIPAVHRYLSSGEGTRRSTTARARQAPASAEVARCGHTDPADGIPGMPPPGSRCGSCRQGCTVVSTNGFHEGLCSHMVVQGPLDVGPKLGRRSSSSVLQASSSVSSCFSVGGSTSRSACVAAVSFVIHVFGNFRAQVLVPASVTPQALHPGDSHPRAHTLGQATVVDWQLDLGRPWDLSRLERQLWPHPPTRSR